MTMGAMQRALLGTMERMQQMEAEMNLLRTNNPQTAADSARLEHAITSAVTKGQASWDDNVNSFLGIEIHYDLNKGELSMEVTAKVNGLFEKHKPLSDLHGSNVPYLASFDKFDDPDPELTQVQIYIKEHFPQIAGSLIYLAITARPDLAPIVNSAETDEP